MNINFDKLWLIHADGLSQQQNRIEELENVISTAVQDLKDFQNKYIELYQEVRSLRNENDNLKIKIKELEFENANDYKDLRKFQNKYIESDQKLRDIQEKKDILENKIKELENKIFALENNDAKDYIDLTEILMRYKSALFKIAFIKNEWDDPIDFINDLKQIAKKALVN